MMEKYVISNFENDFFNFLKIHFVNMETDPGLW
jgi:hypothetical protein